MPIIEVRNLFFRYSRETPYILNNISFEVSKGDIILLAGPSGCGKTTLARALIGLVPQFYKGDYKGEVIIDGMHADKTPVSKLSLKIGYLFQNPDSQIVMSTVERDIAFSLEFRKVDRKEMYNRVKNILKILRIEHLANRRIETLSGGEKQLVALAGILIVNPKILIFDEPSAYLSPVSLKIFINLLRELNEKYNTTMIIIDHRLDLLSKIADKIMIMYDGKVIHYDKPKKVFKMMLNRRYGVNIPTSVKIYERLIARGLRFRDIPLDYTELVKAILEVL